MCKFFFKNVPGVLKRTQICLGGGILGLRGIGKRYTSSYDHDPCPANILERSGLAVKSYHPETLAADVLYIN